MIYLKNFKTNKMKKFKAIFLLTIVSILTSCSSDNDSSSSSTSENFNFKYDNQQINVTEWEALRSENTIAVTGYGENGVTVSFEFNDNGDIGEVNTYSVSSFDFPDSQAQKYYTNESFNFELVSLNDDNKTVKVNFSGKVYEDAYDLTSTSVNIEGSFLVKYTVITPQVSGLNHSAKIDGANWYSSTSDQSGGFFSGEDITLDSYNGGVYKLGVTINHDNTTTGAYSFTSASSTNKVVLSKYNTSLDYFEEFECTGSVNITSKEVGSQLTVISGTYSFTAVNLETNAQVVVTAGAFKDVYSNY